MSEAERKKRISYKRKRKTRIFIQSAILALVALLIFVSVVNYDQINKEYYINYTESSSVDYRVKVPKTADFYKDHLEDYKEYADENGDLWLPSNYAYAAKAVSVIRASINYQLNMETRGVDYEYTYRIFSTAEIVDTKTKQQFQMPVYLIEKSDTPIVVSSDKALDVTKVVEINYHDYNSLVEEFENKLGIQDATETLVVTMEVEVKGSSESFADDSNNKHTISIRIPLAESSFSVNYSTSVTNGDNKVLAKKNAGNREEIYKFAVIGFSALELVLIIVLIAYISLTRNHDVNYSIRVRRLVNNYRSFIQQVTNGFDITGYQVLKIATFNEMLAIRDTIQSPILMSENKDQTKTQFFIPTNTKILYLYELKVDNYDEIYGSHPEWTDGSIIPDTTKKTSARAVQSSSSKLGSCPEVPELVRGHDGVVILIRRKCKCNNSENTTYQVFTEK